MFGLSKLFSSKSVQKQPIITALAAYRSAAFAVGIAESFIDTITQNDDKSLHIKLTLPFAGQSEMPLVEQHVSESLNVPVTISAKVIIKEAAKFKVIKHIV
ncbi:MAG: sodium:proton antiporter, partial [Pseudoalteromonas sp.]